MVNEEIETANAKVMTRVRTTGDPDLDRLAWDKLEAEFQNGSMLGPFYDLDEIPGVTGCTGVRRLVPIFGIIERHGGAVVDSVRVIDDCRIPNLNN